MQASVSLSYSAKDSVEFLYLVNSLKSLGISVNTNVSQSKSPPVIAAKQTGPLESYYIKTTGKSMRAAPGADREEVARERLVSIGVNLATIIAIKKSDSSSTESEVPESSSSVFGALDDIDEGELSGNTDDHVHFADEDTSGEPF